MCGTKGIIFSVLEMSLFSPRQNVIFHFLQKNYVAY